MVATLQIKCSEFSANLCDLDQGRLLSSQSDKTNPDGYRSIWLEGQSGYSNLIFKQVNIYQYRKNPKHRSFARGYIPHEVQVWKVKCHFCVLQISNCFFYDYVGYHWRPSTTTTKVLMKYSVTVKMFLLTEIYV